MIPFRLTTGNLKPKEQIKISENSIFYSQVNAGQYLNSKCDVFLKACTKVNCAKNEQQQIYVLNPKNILGSLFIPCLLNTTGKREREREGGRKEASRGRQERRKEGKCKRNFQGCISSILYIPYFCSFPNQMKVSQPDQIQ